jgi:hypothetical protein
MILATHGIVGSQILQFTSGLLDTYTGAAAAYSLRKLRVSYTGSAIRVRRGSDNAEQDIGFSGENLDIASIQTFCSGTNGFVTSWYDQSGNGYNATQTTAAYQPQIVSSGSVILDNNKPCLSFYMNRTILKLTPTALYNSSALCSFEVFSSTNAAAANTNSIISWLFGVGGSRNLARFSSTGALSGEFMTLDVRRTSGGTERLGSTTYRRNANEKVIENCFFLSSGTSFYKNSSIQSLNLSSGGASTSTNYSPANGNLTSQLWIGGEDGYTVTALSKFSEMIFYPSDQSSNLIGINSNINSYYGIY